MFLNPENHFVNEININNYQIYYRGVFFYKNLLGDDAINAFVQNDGFDFKNVRGNFVVEINDLKQHKVTAFTDNSGVFRIYHSNNFLSDSFLELLNQFSAKSVSISKRQLVEFVQLGYIHSGNTFVNGIRVLDRNEYIIVDADKNISIIDKGLKAICDSSDIEFDQGLESVLKLCKDYNISIDLTGGIDSRLLVAYCESVGLDFETAISGQPDNLDIRIAQEAANSIRKQFHPTYHSIENVDINKFQDIFQMTDAQVDILGYHRNDQFNQDRVKRNISLQISGVGGELYKDFWWLQDFPFYNRKKSDIAKLFDLRIQSITFPHSILSDNLAPESKAFRESVLSELGILKKNTNTQTYDNIYYNYKMRGMASAYLTSASRCFNVYAPLLELDFVRYAFNLKRRERFFNNFHRKLVSLKNNNLAKIRTTEGVSCSDKDFHKLIDLFGYVLNKQTRLFKIIVRKLVKKTLLQESPTHSDFYNSIKSKVFTEEIIMELKMVGIVNKDFQKENIPNQYLGRLFTIALLLRRMNEKSINFEFKS